MQTGGVGPPEGGKDDSALGRLALENGLITADQLREALAEQGREAAAGRARPRALGNLLAERGFITPEQLVALTDALKTPASPSRYPPFGKYKLFRELGRGGMGVVYEAVDQPSGRRVALKMMLTGPQAEEGGSSPDEERFLREAHLSAGLEKHPHLVCVYEAGVIDGKRYLAMEIIDGQPMSRWRKSGSVSVRQQVALLRDVALAVHHAHRQNVIHRDLKPANILVDEKNQPHVTDFGLAKAVGQDVSASLTASGMVMGTPSYMSPEQAQGFKSIDARTDVYAIGVMLYETLTGRLPFTGETAIEILMKAVKNPVPLPSAIVRPGANPSLNKAIEGICLKALSKKPKDRYLTAEAMAADLTRWLKGEEVHVQAPTSTRRRVAARKTLPAWAWAAGGAGAIILVVLAVALGAGSSAGPEKPAPAEAAAPRIKEEAERQRKLEAARKEAEERARAEDLARREAEAKARAAAEAKSDAERKRLEDELKALQAQLRLKEEERRRADEDRRKAEEQLKETPVVEPAAAADSGGRVLKGHGDGVWTIAFSPDGKVLASAGGDIGGTPTEARTSGKGDYKIRLWDVASAGLLMTLSGHQGTVRQLAFSPDGSMLVSGSWDKTVKVWDAVGGQELRTLGVLSGFAEGVAFSPDGKSVAAAGKDGAVRMWDPRSGKLLRVLDAHPGGAMAVAFSRDGKRFASGGFDNLAKLWDATTWKELRVLPGHAAGVESVVFNPGGHVLVSESWDKTVKLWDVLTGKEIRTVPAMAPVAFNSDGSLAACSARDRLIRVWDAGLGNSFATFAGHSAECLQVAFSPDGRTLASASFDRTIRLWSLGDLAAAKPEPTKPAPAPPPPIGNSGVGSILCETWSGVKGAAVVDLLNHPDFPDKPAATTRLPTFEISADAGDNYGTRVRGFVHPPITGLYVFWIASDDRSELWLSTDENPANKARIAGVQEFSAAREWAKYPAQQSATVTLKAGRRYYLEALHKEFTGSDHLAVGWQLPDGTYERPIPGKRLSPAVGRASETGKGPREAAPRAPVDLLKLIDLKIDAVRGAWKMEGGMLSTAPAACLVQVPYLLPEEYDLAVVAALKSGGPDGFIIALPLGDRHILVALDAHDEAGSGLENVDGKGVHQNETFSRARAFNNQNPKTIVCSVRKKRVSVSMDGRTIIDWAGDFKRLSAADDDMTNKKAPYLRGDGPLYQISQMTLVPVGAPGQKLR